MGGVRDEPLRSLPSKIVLTQSLKETCCLIRPYGSLRFHSKLTLLQLPQVLKTTHCFFHLSVSSSFTFAQPSCLYLCSSIFFCITLSLLPSFLTCYHLSGPPGPPTSIQVEEITDATASLSWRPGPDNHSPITAYTIQARTPFSLGWQAVTTGKLFPAMHGLLQSQGGGHSSLCLPVKVLKM